MQTTLNRMGYPAHRALTQQGAHWVDREIITSSRAAELPQIRTVGAERKREAACKRLAQLFLARADFNARALFDTKRCKAIRRAQVQS